MAFYNNKLIIAHTNMDEIFIFKSMDKTIFMDYYNPEENNLEEIIREDILDEFDVMIRDNGEIYLLYQDLDYSLKIIGLKGKDKEVYNLTNEKLDKIFQICIFETQSYTNILYVVKGVKENTYSIRHHILEEDNWISFHVEDVGVDKILNPIKVIKEEEGFLLSYYNENKISIKRFNLKDKSWEESKILTDNNQKLYMDIIIEGEYLHLVYCDFIEEKLDIRYIRYEYREGNILIDVEHNISQGINPTNPTLLVYDKKIWIVWNESLNLFSRFSKDNGNTWSPIYLWKDAKNMDFVRYKYIDNRHDANMKLDNCFGSIGEEIKFLGFGPLEDVEEIDKKKLEKEINYPTIMGNWRI